MISFVQGMIIGVLKADPTPNKPMRKRMKRTKSMGHKSKPIQLKLNLKTNDKIVNAVEEMDEDIMDRTQGITLPTNVKYINRYALITSFQSSSPYRPNFGCKRRYHAYCQFISFSNVDLSNGH
jgi:hypothetical protein